jgi:hypothetical protein
MRTLESYAHGIGFGPCALQLLLRNLELLLRR